MAVMALTLAACTELSRTHGYAPAESALTEIVVGRDTRATVQTIAGRPGATGLMARGGWYYVKSEFRQYGWREPVEIDRSVVAILFDDDGVVSNIERYGLEDGRVVALSRRVTDDNTAGLGFLQQLFGNVGNLDAGTLLDDG